MGYYDDIYLKRLNRYGYNFQERIQNRREENFDRQLFKSIYYVTFDFNGETCEGELTHFKEDETRILQYLLTKVSVEIPGGTILEFYGTETTEPERYMVYYDENYKAKGYNKYIMLKMTHYITWEKNHRVYSSWAYMYGQENNMLKDELKSRSRNHTIYDENMKSSFFIMPLTPDLIKDDYFEVKRNKILEPYRVTGLDRQSTDGVMFVTIDPIYEYDHSKKPEYDPESEDEKPEDFFWLNQGVEPND